MGAVSRSGPIALLFLAWTCATTRASCSVRVYVEVAVSVWPSADVALWGGTNASVFSAVEPGYCTPYATLGGDGAGVRVSKSTDPADCVYVPVPCVEGGFYSVLVSSDAQGVVEAVVQGDSSAVTSTDPIDNARIRFVNAFRGAAGGVVVMSQSDECYHCLTLQMTGTIPPGQFSSLGAGQFPSVSPGYFLFWSAHAVSFELRNVSGDLEVMASQSFVFQERGVYTMVLHNLEMLSFTVHRDVEGEDSFWPLYVGLGGVVAALAFTKIGFFMAEQMASSGTSFRLGGARGAEPIGVQESSLQPTSSRRVVALDVRVCARALVDAWT